MSDSDRLEITWFGQSMFLISGGGLRIVCDPASPQTGYNYSPVEADIVLISHDHFDHNYVSGIAGNPQVINSSGTHSFRDIEIAGLSSFHDTKGGRERGTNIIYRWNQAGFSLAHLGDLGEYPSNEMVEKLAGLDIVMMPVGGVFTIDGAQAARLAGEIKPRILIPMHYGTPSCKIPLEKLQEFTGRAPFPVRSIEDRPLIISAESMPESSEIWVVPYS